MKRVWKHPGNFLAISEAPPLKREDWSGPSAEERSSPEAGEEVREKEEEEEEKAVFFADRPTADD